jgi:hypothetical protein
MYQMKWRWLWQCSLAVVLIALGKVQAAPASGTMQVPLAAVPKYALVIGNSAYEGNRRSLKNPAPDARLMRA